MEPGDRGDGERGPSFISGAAASTDSESRAPRTEEATPLVEIEGDFSGDAVESFESASMNPLFVGMGRWTRAAHLLTSAVVLVLFVVSLAMVQWREMEVDRDSLRAAAEDTDDFDVLRRMNDTMFFSRRMGVYQECIVREPHGNLTEPRQEGDCATLPFWMKSGPQPPTYFTIQGLMSCTMVVGPVIAFFALVAILLQIRVYMLKAKPSLATLACLVNILFFNTFICLVFLICMIVINFGFTMDDPGFPVTWPLLLRRYSKLHPTEPCLTIYVIAVISQFLVLLADILIARRFIVFSRHRPSGNHWYTWFLN